MTEPVCVQVREQVRGRAQRPVWWQVREQVRR